MKNTLLVIAVLIIGVGGYFGYQMLYPKPMPKPSNTTASTPESSPLPMNFNLAQIAQHNSKDSCWIAIEGKVYDMTPFVESGFHPGKEAILEGCGIDATELFNTRPMGSKTPHSDKARGNLPRYFIGDLAQS